MVPDCDSLLAIVAMLTSGHLDTAQDISQASKRGRNFWEDNFGVNGALDGLRSAYNKEIISTEKALELLWEPLVKLGRVIQQDASSDVAKDLQKLREETFKVLCCFSTMQI